MKMTSTIKKLLLVFFILLIVMIVFSFVFANQQEVSVRFLAWQTGYLPISIFITGGFLVGLLVGPLLVVTRVIAFKERHRP